MNRPISVPQDSAVWRIVLQYEDLPFRRDRTSAGKGPRSTAEKVVSSNRVEQQHGGRVTVVLQALIKCQHRDREDTRRVVLSSIGSRAANHCGSDREASARRRRADGRNGAIVAYGRHRI